MILLPLYTKWLGLQACTTRLSYSVFKTEIKHQTLVDGILLTCNVQPLATSVVFRFICRFLALS